ncbi:hypothetical protein E4O98_07415 [Pseudomonas sp. W2Jun17]|nr:hypothetical protein [Pseudomonas sp. W2Jun17]
MELSQARHYQCCPRFTRFRASLTCSHLTLLSRLSPTCADHELLGLSALSVPLLPNPLFNNTLDLERPTELRDKMLAAGIPL